MTNEERMARLTTGDESALSELCEANRGLIRDQARRAANAYHCVIRDDRGRETGYTKETLSELESVGMTAFLECVRSGNYDAGQGLLTTYVVPFLDGAMRRHLESSLGTLSLDRESMGLVRRAQRLRNEEGLSHRKVAETLEIPLEEAAKHIAYPTHFLSVYDLTAPEDDNDVFDYIAADPSAGSPKDIVYRRIRMEYFRELFNTLPRKERDILGKCYGVFGYRREPLRDIAMYHMMKEDAVEKARKRALQRLRNSYPGSRMQLWSAVHWMMERAAAEGRSSPLPGPAWWEQRA